MFTLSSYGVVNVPVRSFLISGSFLCDLRNAGCTWWLGHTWTLAVEEQFYLVWPIIFIVLSGRSRSIFLVLMLAVLAAVSLLYPIAVSFMHIALGSLFASSAVMRRTISRYAKMRTVTAATSFIFLQSFLGSQPIVLWLSEVIGAAALTWIVFGTINGRSPFLQIVSMETFRRIGLISYSLYLWQQLATGASDWDRAYVVPILLIVPAILSYALIERPLIKVGHRLSRSIMDDRGEIPSQRAIPRNQPDYRLGPQ
jgi:peptidoglycan/LPS O-acetylase OafA/YrhL